MRRVLIVLTFIGVWLPAAPVAAQEPCPPTDAERPGEEAPDVGRGTTWPEAERLLSGRYDIDTRPADVDGDVLDQALVMDWGVEAPDDDASPLIAIVCLGGEVPDLSGQTRSTAEAALWSIGFRLVPPAGSAEDWTVIGQAPNPGELIPLGQPVSVRLGPPTVIVPTSPAEPSTIPPTMVEPVPTTTTEPVATTVAPTVTTPTPTPTPASTPTSTPESGSVSTAVPVAAGAGVIAAAGVAIIFARHRDHRRWRRRVTTLTWSGWPDTRVDDDRPARVVRVETILDAPVEHLEERP